MKKPIGPFSLAFVFLLVSSIGCNLTSMPVLPTSIPSPEPTSTAMAANLPDVSPTNISADTQTAAQDLKPPFGSQYATVEFIDKEFELKFTDTDKPVKIYEYYLPDESPSDWIELVEIQIYPVNPDGNKPIDFAKRTADAFIKQYPDMRYSLLTKNNSDEAVLDFFYPTATRDGYLELDAFKYFKDPSSSQVIGFHYAKNIEDINSSRTYDDVLADIKKTIKEIESAMAAFNLFSK